MDVQVRPEYFRRGDAAKPVTNTAETAPPLLLCRFSTSAASGLSTLASSRLRTVLSTTTPLALQHSVVKGGARSILQQGAKSDRVGFANGCNSCQSTDRQPSRSSTSAPGTREENLSFPGACQASTSSVQRPRCLASDHGKSVNAESAPTRRVQLLLPGESAVASVGPVAEGVLSADSGSNASGSAAHIEATMRGDDRQQGGPDAAAEPSCDQREGTASDSCHPNTSVAVELWEDDGAVRRSLSISEEAQRGIPSVPEDGSGSPAQDSAEPRSGGASSTTATGTINQLVQVSVRCPEEVSERGRLASSPGSTSSDPGTSAKQVDTVRSPGAMSLKFRGAVQQVISDLRQVWDGEEAESLVLPRSFCFLTTCLRMTVERNLSGSTAGTGTVHAPASLEML